MNNYYEILGVSHDASAETIKKNFRHLSKRYHPDKNRGSKAAEIKFKEISAAYAVLRDPQSRADYDKTLSAHAKKEQNIKQEAVKKQKPDPPKDQFDINDINLRFAEFFGFDPENNHVDMNLNKAKKGKNPMDTSHLFETFFKPK